MFKFLCFLGVLIAFSSSTQASETAAHLAIKGDSITVPTGDIKYQGDELFCWAYTMTSYLESLALRQGMKVQLSARYLGFSLMANRIYEKLNEFDKIVQASNSEDFKFLSIRNKLVVAHYYQNLDTEQGFFEKGAVQLLDEVGILPENVFHSDLDSNIPPDNRSIVSRDFAPSSPLSTAIDDFVWDIVLDSKKIAAYRTDKNLFRKEFFNALQTTAITPTDSFKVGDSTFNTKSLLKKILKGDTSDLVTVTAYGSADFDLVLSYVEQSLKAGIAVPFSMDTYDDFNYSQLKTNGIWSWLNCPHYNCKSLIGDGHAELIIGMIYDTGNKISGLILQNSWGVDYGLTKDGRPRQLLNGGFDVADPRFLNELNSKVIAERNTKSVEFVFQKQIYHPADAEQLLPLY